MVKKVKGNVVKAWGIANGNGKVLPWADKSKMYAKEQLLQEICGCKVVRVEVRPVEG